MMRKDDSRKQIQIRLVHTAMPVLRTDTPNADTEEAARETLEQGESSNTRRSYSSALRYWSGWYEMRYNKPFSLPVEVLVVKQFLVDHLERANKRGALTHELPEVIDGLLVEKGLKRAIGPLSLSTVLHRIAVLSKMHVLKKLDNPTRDPAILTLIRSYRRGYASRSVAPGQKTAITKEPLQAMLDTCGEDLAGIRDRALLLFAWASGGRRRSEVAAASIEHLRNSRENTYIYDLTHSKTDQMGSYGKANALKPIVGVAAAALTQWIRVSGVVEGPIFRQVRHDKATDPLSGQAVWRIVKRRAQLAGLEGDFGAHSLRSGFVTEAGRQGVPLAEAMALTGHRSVNTILRYFQAGAVEETKAARLMEVDGD